MGEIIVRKVRGMNWKAKIALVLMFTLVFSTFMHQGLFKPKKAEAAAIGNATTMIRPTGGTGSTGPLTITNANWSCGVGSSRLLVIAVTGEGASGALNSFAVTATKGAGINFTPAANTAASRTAAYVGYLTESQIVASGTNSIVITAPGVATGFDASIACYSNVDQNNPIVATSVVEGDTAATVTGAFSVAAVNQGMVVVAMADATAQTITSSTWAGRTDVYNAGTGYGTHGQYKAVAATGTETGTFTRGTSARYGIAAVSLRPLADFTIGDGTLLGNGPVGPSTTNNTLDSFTMAMNTGSGTVTSLTVTGSTNFTATNIGTNGVKVWRDTGTVPGAWDAGDTLISSASTAIAANATTITISSQSVTTTPQNYIVTVDIASGATVGQAFTGNISGVVGTGLGTVLADNDTTSASLTVTAPGNLTIGDGAIPINRNAQPNSANNALDGFTMSMAASTSTSTVTSLTITGSTNFTATNIPTNGVKVWRDTGTAVGYWDAGDTLVSSASTAVNASHQTTVTISSEPISYPAKNYLVTVDTTAGATIGQSFTATVTAATGTNLGAPIYSDLSSATLTVNKLDSSNTSCGSCHGYPPIDGTRSGASGAFVGDHNAHVVKVGAVCSVCHVAPATTTSADFATGQGISRCRLPSPLGHTARAQVLLRRTHLLLVHAPM